jgi:hypothetical protein
VGVRAKARHDSYKGHHIRSSPLTVNKQWKVQLNITFLFKDETKLTKEYLNEERLYPTQDEAHMAGLEWGRGIINEEIQKRGPGLAGGVLGL